jgi:hypothetical protein
MWPQSVTISQLLRGANGIRPPETVLKDCTSEGTAPDPDGVSYARTPKVTKTEIFLKRSSYTSALMFQLSRPLVKGKLMSLAKAVCLSKDNMTFNGIQLLSGTLWVLILHKTDSLMFTLWLDQHRPLVHLAPNMISP